MKAKVIKAFKNGSLGICYEVGQIIPDADEKLVILGLVEKVEEPAKKTKKTVDKE